MGLSATNFQGNIEMPFQVLYQPIVEIGATLIMSSPSWALTCPSLLNKITVTVTC